MLVGDNIKDVIIKELKTISNKDKIIVFKRFFKTEKGQYGEGDQFLGIDVPSQRKISQKYYKEISLSDIDLLIKSVYHEVRLTSLIILTLKMKKASQKEQEEIYLLYLKNTKYVNNWDLVDLSAPLIVGAYLYNNRVDRKVLYELANSEDLWQKRISILSTYYFIKHNEFDDTLKIAAILLNHKHDLIHKAVGWMLREVGNRDYNEEYAFLLKYHKTMPRTMLRYAIEKFEEITRKKFLNNGI